MRHFLLLVVVGITVYPLWGHPLAQEEESNQIIFQNQSGQSALVKLIGPSSHVVSVPNGESRSVAVDSGEYYFITQYGKSPNQYSYRRSDKFTVNAAPGQVARVSITLHTVPGGNFSTRGSSAAEFNAAAGQESRGGVRRTDIPTSKPTSPGASSEADLTYWKEVDKTNPEELEAYLRKYPDGEFADLARARLKRAGRSLQGKEGTNDGVTEGKGSSPANDVIDGHQVPNLAGTTYCMGMTSSFHFQAGGVLRIEPNPTATKDLGIKTVMDWPGHGTWAQDGKSVHLTAVYDGDVPTSVGRTRESSGEFWWSDEGRVGFWIRLNEWNEFAKAPIGYRKVDLLPGPCPEL
jgi:hypothetical protein